MQNCITNEIIDIENIQKNTHKQSTFSKQQWKKLEDEFINSYKEFNTHADIVKFKKKLQQKYKISISKCDLIKLYNNLNIDNLNVKNLIIKKKTKIRFRCFSNNSTNISTSRIYR